MSDWTQQYCSRAAIPRGCLSLLVKPAEMDCFIYFVAERLHKALGGTLQPSLQNGCSQKYPGPNLGVTFSSYLGKHPTKSIWLTECFFWIYVCIYSVWVVYLLFIRVMCQCSTVNPVILVSSKAFPASKPCMSTHSISKLSVKPGRSVWLSLHMHTHTHRDMHTQAI